MRTVGFYSYKGGVGRSLLLANMALALDRLGHRVCVLDLDLEAPGLHYKLAVDPSARGVLEYITSDRDDSLDVSAFMGRVRNTRDMWAIPAPNLSRLQDYWQRMEQLSDSGGALTHEQVARFLLLKGAVQSAGFDFLIVDSRTGISETSILSTALLSDVVVLCSLDTEESRDGTLVVRDGLQRIPGVAEPQAVRRVVEVMMRTVSQLQDEFPPTTPNSYPRIRQDNQLQAHEHTVLTGKRATDDLVLDYADAFTAIFPDVDAKPLADALADQIDPETAPDIYASAIARLAPMGLSDSQLLFWLNQEISAMARAEQGPSTQPSSTSLMLLAAHIAVNAADGEIVAAVDELLKANLVNSRRRGPTTRVSEEGWLDRVSRFLTKQHGALFDKEGALTPRGEALLVSGIGQLSGQTIEKVFLVLRTPQQAAVEELVLRAETSTARTLTLASEIAGERGDLRLAQDLARQAVTASAPLEDIELATSRLAELCLQLGDTAEAQRLISGKLPLGNLPGPFRMLLLLLAGEKSAARTQLAVLLHEMQEDAVDPDTIRALSQAVDALGGEGMVEKVLAELAFPRP